MMTSEPHVVMTSCGVAYCCPSASPPAWSWTPEIKTMEFPVRSGGKGEQWVWLSMFHRNCNEPTNIHALLLRMRGVNMTSERRSKERGTSLTWSHMNELGIIGDFLHRYETHHKVAVLLCHAHGSWKIKTATFFTDAYKYV